MRRAQGAVESDRQYVSVANRIPEGFGCLTRERAARRIGDGARDDQRQLDTHFAHRRLHGEDSGLGIERVEHRFDQQQVAAAQNQATCRFAVGRHQIIEGYSPKARVANIGRQRSGTRCRTQCPGDKSRHARGARNVVGHLARQSCAAIIQFGDQRFHTIVGLRHRRRVEGVAFDNIGARLEVSAVDARDQLGTGQRQQIVITLDIAPIAAKSLAAIAIVVELFALDHRAHRTVQHDDALI